MCVVFVFRLIKMTVGAKCLKIIPLFRGIVVTALGVYLVIVQPQEPFIIDMIAQQAELVKGNPLYEKVWTNLDLQFRVYLFDVENPDEVMEGATPEVTEHGPYVYDMNIKKNVLKIDEEADEMIFNTVRTYHFNEDLSGGREDDVITMINSAYVGTIATMAAQFPAFIKKLGNDIEKLFPDMDDLFIRAKAVDILFDGLPMACDPAEYPELKLICGFLMGKKPASISDTNIPGFYKWSFFHRLNGTAEGPITVNRGVKNKTRLGDTVAFKDKRKQRVWGSDECNQVMGTDSITWAPMPEKLDHVVSFEPQICRWSVPWFKEEVIVNGMIGWRYQVDERNWQPEAVECYCPLVARKPVCPTTGVMDLGPCQEAPIYYSEPHYLFGDESLHDYAKGLNPDADKHASFVIIEPLSGAPLAGSKMMQLNARLARTPGVNMLANVTDGYVPILWCEEAANSTVESFAEILQAHRFIRLMRYLSHVPLVLGIFLVIKAVYLHDDGKNYENVTAFVTSSSVLIRGTAINAPRRTIPRRSRLDLNRSFQ